MPQLSATSLKAAPSLESHFLAGAGEDKAATSDLIPGGERECGISESSAEHFGTRPQMAIDVKVIKVKRSESRYGKPMWILNSAGGDSVYGIDNMLAGRPWNNGESTRKPL